MLCGNYETFSNLFRIGDHGELWLNADILQGPGGNVPMHDPHMFLQAVEEHARADAVLSLGYTVGKTAPWDAGYAYVLWFVLVILNTFTQATFSCRASVLDCILILFSIFFPCTCVAIVFVTLNTQIYYFSCRAFCYP